MRWSERATWRWTTILLGTLVAMTSGCSLFGSGSGRLDGPVDAAADGGGDDTGEDTGSPSTGDEVGVEVDGASDGTSNGGRCPDGGTTDAPGSTPGRLVATPASGGVVAIDGRLEEQSAAVLRLEDPGDESDNRASLHGRWTQQHLYLGAEVSDDALEAESSVGPWENDSLEVAFDPDASGGSSLQGDERKWVVDIEGTVNGTRAGNNRWGRETSYEVETATGETDDGYVVEMRIPWEAVGGLEAAGADDRPGMIAVLNDRDDGEVRRFGWTGSIDQLGTPDEWGVLALADEGCAGDAGPRDTGPGDASDGGDAGDGDTDPPTPRLGPPRYVQESDFNFQTTLNAVEDLGMDPTGEEPIDDQLDQARAPNTLIEFPPGEYKIAAGPERDATHKWGEGADHFGLKGLGERPKDVQFVLEKQPANYGGRWISDNGGEGLMLKNFAIQMTRDRHTSADILVLKSDLFLIEKVEYAGLIPNDNHGNNGLLHCYISDESGVGEVNRLYIREGSIMPEYPDGMVGLRSAGRHQGTMYWTDLWLEQISSSAFRFSNVPGRVGVEGGYFKNNANTNLRGGAGSHPDGPSYIQGATVVIDTEDMNDYQPDGESLTATQVLRVDASGNGFSGMTIEDLDIYFRNPPPGSEIVVRPDFGNHGEFTVRDTRILNDTSRPNSVISNVSTGNDTARFENVQVTGSGSGAFQAAGGATAEIADSCVESNFSIGNFDAVDNLDRSDCQAPTAPEDPPHAH